MAHESVLDVIHDEYDDDSDYEDGCEEEDEAAGELQSGFKAMDITRTTQELGNLGGVASFHEDGELLVANDGHNGVEGHSRTAGVVYEGKDGYGRNQKKKKKRKGERRKQSVPRQQSVSIERFVVQTCRRLEETKFPLFREAVDRMGMETMNNLLNQVDAVESCGGQMTADGLRRRTAGGVLWNLLRDFAGPILYKEIMKEGNRKYLEKQKARQIEREREKGTGKRHHGEVDTEGDEWQNVKRRRTSMNVDGLATTASHLGRGERLPRTSLREEADNARVPAALQNAWIQGLKKQSGDSTLNLEPSEGKASAGPTPTGMKKHVSERIRMTVSYSDLVEEGQIIATDNPIHDVTEVGDPDNVREDGEIAD